MTAKYHSHIEKVVYSGSAEGRDKLENDQTAIEQDIKDMVEDYFIQKRGAHKTRKGRAASYDLKGHDEVLDLARKVSKPLLKHMHPHLDDKAIDKMLEKDATAEMYMNKFLGHGWYDHFIDQLSNNPRNIMRQPFFNQLTQRLSENTAQYEVNESLDYLAKTRDEGAREAMETKLNTHAGEHGHRMRKGMKQESLASLLKDAHHIDEHYILDNRGRFAKKD